jgi:hypothetical protein
MKFSKTYSSSTLAFPKTAEYGAAIERSRPVSLADRAVNWTLCLAVVAIVLSLAFQTLPF